jgi:pimeloyl-ACP methyl ester carboxylesterase
LIDTLHSQLAFWDMQRRGVAAGEQAAGFVQRLLAETEELRGARIHFLGHSFGALVVCNAARRLAYDPAFTKRIDTLCLLEAAFASDWFRGEKTLQDKVDVLASIFSRYDTATGFYYPVANHARLCAGQIGVCADGPRFQPEPKGRYALLVRPPDLGPTICRPRVLNIDASRLLYEGPPAAGGGHDDIFKDDVLYLLWAVSRLPKEDNPLGDAETAPLGQASPARP